ERFSAPESQPALTASLLSLRAGAHELESHGRSQDASFAYLSRSLARAAEEIQRRYRGGAPRGAALPPRRPLGRLGGLPLAAPEPAGQRPRAFALRGRSAERADAARARPPRGRDAPVRDGAAELRGAAARRRAPARAAR